MMSAAQTPTTPVSRMEALQCHFTWDLNLSKAKLLYYWETLEQLGTEEGNFWLGPIYNMRGYIQCELESYEDALSLFNQAAEAFQRTRRADSDQGPWLVVNHGNLAWLHHRLGQEAQSQAHLSKVHSLMEKYPPPSQDELHPEICAEKAWTLMKLSADKKRLAADYFQKATRMQPDMVEWNTSYVLALLAAAKHSSTGLEADILEKVRMAKEKDPENLCLAGRYLEQRAEKGERVEDEARELAREVLRNPVSSDSGLRQILWIYAEHISADKAVALAETALKKHPDVPYLKTCASICYKWRIILLYKERPTEQSMIQRAISLHKEVISLYPHSTIMTRIDLATLYAKLHQGMAKAEQTNQELLESDLEPDDRQMVYHKYADFEFYIHHNKILSLEYHMKAAEIPIQSFYRTKSISFLKKESSGNSDIKEFLANLQNPESF